MKKVDLCIIGGGASGLVSACAHTGKIALIEKADRVGKKILLTGNGRCNLTNLDLDKKYYSNPTFYSKVFSAHKSKLDEFMQSLGLFTRVDGAGRVYPHSNHASSVLDALRLKAESNSEIFTSESVNSIVPANGGYQVVTDKQTIFAQKVIYSCGGGEFSPLQKLDIPITKTKKSLCPIETETDKLRGLDGVKAQAKITLYNGDDLLYAESGEILFRTYGVSGVAVFNCSAYIARDIVKGNHSKFSVKIDLLDGLKVEEVKKVLLDRIANGVIGEKLFTGILQRKIGERILKNMSLSPERGLSLSHLDGLMDSLTAFSLSVKGLKDDGAQVVSGGINADCLTENLECKKYPNLFIVGEAVDMDGVCGGYNLNWAFLSAVGTLK